MVCVFCLWCLLWLGLFYWFVFNLSLLLLLSLELLMLPCLGHVGCGFAGRVLVCKLVLHAFCCEYFVCLRD